jgi:hypothetical protein
MPKAAPIIHHPDVRRMLMTMRAYTEGCRAMALVAAAAYDAAHAHPDAATREQNQAFYEFMVPLIKGLSTEMSLDVASLGVQVHGGMGFIEETGAAQHLRDAKILSIYEGTTAIQANDLVGRKTARDGGRGAGPSPRRSSHRSRAGPATSRPAGHGRRLEAGRKAFSMRWTSSPARPKASPNAAFAGSVPYLMLAGTVVAGWQMARALMAAEDRLAAASRPTSCAPRSPPATSTPTTSSTRHPACATASSTGPMPSPPWPWSPSDEPSPSKLPPVLQNLPLPIIGSPLFIISNPKLVIAQCIAGVVGSACRR